MRVWNIECVDPFVSLSVLLNGHGAVNEVVIEISRTWIECEADHQKHVDL